MWKFVENCCYQRIAPFGVRKISPVWESSETDPAKVCVFGENNSSYQKKFGRFQREERNEKWTTKRYGERGEKRELLTFTLRHRAHDFPTFSGFNFPSAYFEICTVVRLESVGLVLKNASAPPRRVATTWKVSPPMRFQMLKLFENFQTWFQICYHEGAARLCV